MMDKRVKELIRQLVPPAFRTWYQRGIRRSGYFGNYASWRVAENASSGYDADLILERVRRAMEKVRDGEAVYERDSVLFDEVQYAWPLLAGLLWIASQNGNRLNLLDFGGSLGSSYFQNRRFLSQLAGLRWSIVEQERFVACGRELFEDSRLRFFFSIDDCLKEESPDAILLSSVLPYLERPYDLMEEVVTRGFEYVLIDRTPLLDQGPDRITVQRVPSEIYRASYPAWMLSRDRVLQTFSTVYEMVAEFDSLAGVISLGDTVARDKGFIFRKK